ncbi:hypothetical protein EON65_36500 [archaeon]|nr:MAG: hypothetical protein EON65_36500 [archaeon]
MSDPSIAQLEKAMSVLKISSDDTKTSARRKKVAGQFFMCLHCWKQFKKRRNIIKHINHCSHFYTLKKVKAAFKAAEQKLDDAKSGPARDEASKEYMVALVRFVLLERVL